MAHDGILAASPMLLVDDETFTLHDILGDDLPDGIEFLPEDWEGETERFYVKMTVSKGAIENKLISGGLVRTNLINALEALRKKKNLATLRVTHYLTISIDETHKRKTIIHFFIEHAKS